MAKKKNTILSQENFPVGLLPVGILIFDNNLSVKYVNPALLRMGVINTEIPEEFVGTNLSDISLFPNIDLKQEFNLILQGQPFEKEIKRIFSKNGDMSIVAKAIPVFDGDKFTGGIIVVEDLRSIPEIKMRSSIPLDRSGDILASTFDSVFVTTGKGEITFYGGRQMNTIFPGEKDILKYNIFLLLGNLDKKILKNVEYGVKHPISHKTGDETFHLIVRITPFEDHTNKIFYLFIIEDITPRITETKALKNQIAELEDFASLADEGGLALFSIDRSGNITNWSKGAESFFGIKKIDVFGKSVTHIIPSFNLNDNQNYFKSEYLLKEEKGFGEFRIVKKSPDSGGKSVVICRDIKEEEKKFSELDLSFRQITEMLNSTEDLMCTFDSEGRINKGNLKFYSALGYDPGRTDITLFDIFDEKEFDLDEIIKNGKVKKILPVKSGLGKSFTGEVIFVYNTIKGGVFDSFGCLIRDISAEEKAAQDILLMQSIFETSNDGIAVETGEEVIFVNNSFVRIFGYNSELEIVGRSISNFFSAGDGILTDDDFSSGDLSKEFYGLKNDSTKFLAEVSTASFEFNNKTFKVLIVRDITQIRISQKLIEDSEAKYRSIAENIDDFLWVSEQVDGVLQPVFVTASYVAMTGYKIKDFIGNNQFWFRIIHPEDLQQYFEDLKNLFRNKYKNSGSIEVRILTRNGLAIWIRNKITLVRDGDKIIKMFGLVSDITKQKQAEQEIRLSTENLKSLNEAKDRFISIISHDMRTPFSSILGFTDFLLSEDLNPDEMKKYVSYIQDSTKIMLGLVNSLLDWTRLQTGRMKFEPVKQNLNLIVSKSFSAVSGTALQKSITLINDVPEDITVFVDQNLILQVFNNLFSNAIKFTPAGGRISAGITGRVSGRFLEVFVKDSGVGIRSEDIPKVFKVDTKFTTVGTAGEKGTGLGLSLVKEILEKHGGTIDLESTPGVGTSFIFTIPAASSKIILVESSPTDRVLYTKIIGNLARGYEIEQFKDIASAVAEIQVSVPAVIISGHAFTDGTGLDLIKKVQAMPDRAKIPVIILGNNLGKSEQLAYKEAGVEELFNKPVILQKFKDAIQNSVKTIFNIRSLNT
ncbi:MAG: PAS domain S-box protein [Ignavibacteriales bacterium]|nr:PAS domain S-box protein [Ignavibacteriales bacterium]